ncbi:MAG: hypothetical protein Q4F82_00585 [bacterium]|nr:hypothetical protein [bacterium]
MDNNETKKNEQENTSPSVAFEPTMTYVYSQGAPLTGLLEYLYATLSPNSMRWLGEHLIEHAQSAVQPYTMAEIDAMLEESERDFDAGRCYSNEQVLQMCREAQSA